MDPDEDMITYGPPRWQRWRVSRPIAVAGVAVVALAGGAGIGYAATRSAPAKVGGGADTAVVAPAASASPSASGPAGTGNGPRRVWVKFPGGPGLFGLGMAGGAIHGQLTVPKSGGGYQTVDVQDGTVTAVSTGSVTVKSADGYTATYTVTGNTVIDAKAAGIGSVKKGDTVFVTATVSGSTATAASIFDQTAIKNGRVSFHFPAPSGNGKPMPALPAQPPNA
jgi:hypothetical protein